MKRTPTIRYFEKHGIDRILRCQVKIFRDGSAYITGDEIEIIVDDSPDAWIDAVKRVTSCGYVESNTPGPRAG